MRHHARPRVLLLSLLSLLLLLLLLLLPSLDATDPSMSRKSARAEALRLANGNVDSVDRSWEYFKRALFPMRGGDDLALSEDFVNAGVAAMRSGDAQRAATLMAVGLAFDPLNTFARDNIGELMQGGGKLCFWRGNSFMMPKGSHVSRAGILAAENDREHESLLYFALLLKQKERAGHFSANAHFNLFVALRRYRPSDNRVMKLGAALARDLRENEKDLPDTEPLDGNHNYAIMQWFERWDQQRGSNKSLGRPFDAFKVLPCRKGNKGLFRPATHYFVDGMLLLRSGGRQEAIVFFERAVRTAPDDELLVTALAWAYCLTDRPMGIPALAEGQWERGLSLGFVHRQCVRWSRRAREVSSNGEDLTNLVLREVSTSLQRRVQGSGGGVDGGADGESAADEDVSFCDQHDDVHEAVNDAEDADLASHTCTVNGRASRGSLLDNPGWVEARSQDGMVTFGRRQRAALLRIKRAARGFAGSSLAAGGYKSWDYKLRMEGEGSSGIVASKASMLYPFAGDAFTADDRRSAKRDSFLVVGIPDIGVGNQIATLVSGFVLAFLTNRTMLVSNAPWNQHAWHYLEGALSLPWGAETAPWWDWAVAGRAFDPTYVLQNVEEIEFMQDANVMNSNLLEAMVGGTLQDGRDVAKLLEQFGTAGKIGKTGKSGKTGKNSKNGGVFSSRFVFLVTNQHLAPFVMQNKRYAKILLDVFGRDIFSIAARFLLRPALPLPSAAEGGAAPSFAQRISAFGMKHTMPWFKAAANRGIVESIGNGQGGGGEGGEGGDVGEYGAGGSPTEVPRLFIGIHVRTGMTENSFDAWILNSYEQPQQGRQGIPAVDAAIACVFDRVVRDERLTLLRDWQQRGGVVAGGADANELETLAKTVKVTVVVATDNPISRKLLKKSLRSERAKRLGIDKVVSPPQTASKITRYSKAGLHDALADALLLSRCHALVRTGKTFSHFTSFAGAFLANVSSRVYYGSDMPLPPDGRSRGLSRCAATSRVMLPRVLTSPNDLNSHNLRSVPGGAQRLTRNMQKQRLLYPFGDDLAQDKVMED